MVMVIRRRTDLHRSFQAICDKGIKISSTIAKAYSMQIIKFQQSFIVCDENTCHIICRGFRLGDFFLEAGWLDDCAIVLQACFQLCLHCYDYLRAFHCLTRLLHTYNANCLYKEMDAMFSKAHWLFQRLRFTMPEVQLNLSSLFVEYGAYHFARSQYDKAYRWSMESLRMLKMPGYISKSTLVDVLRLASRACVVKRHFKAAKCLVNHAVTLSQELFGLNHLTYSSTLLDYGFYLLNTDNVSKSVKEYQTALAIRQSVFGGQNLHIAVAHEDLAYASYVCEYSTGCFHSARAHADAAILIFTKILPEKHLLLASSNRVKALILEEIAINSDNEHCCKRLFHESHELHIRSLELTIAAFGEKNVQTAKHYGNLGRLYQSMQFYEEAERMHLKAIAIKEELLGPNDYEVAQSVGHIASLYNYGMKDFLKAEPLYLRSIAISKELYGESYSGLEYDYRGLVRVYAHIGDFEKVLEYDDFLRHWHSVRERRRLDTANEPSDLIENHAINPKDIGNAIDDFFKLLQSERISTYEKMPMAQVARTSCDIAFAGSLQESNTTGFASQGSGHRNVENDSVSFLPPVSLNAVKPLTVKSESDSDVLEDKEVSRILKKFNVVPLKFILSLHGSGPGNLQ